MGRARTVDDIPELPGYMTIAAIAERYSVRKNSVYAMIMHQGLFKLVFKVSKGQSQNGVKDLRPLIVVAENEVTEFFETHQHRLQRFPATEAKRVQEWTRRVKKWGSLQESFALSGISPYGAPTQALIHAYLAANPEDPRPTEEMDSGPEGKSDGAEKAASH